MNMASSCADRICLKLINDVQVRAEDLSEQIQSPDWQPEKQEIKTVTSVTDKMLNFLLTNLDLLEKIIQPPDGVADDSELGDIEPVPHLKCKEKEILTARVNKRFQETLPDLYTNIQVFFKEQSDNISDILYMVKNHNGNNEDAKEVLDVIDKGVGLLKEFYTNNITINVASQPTSSTERICLKLINDAQARTENLFTEIQSLDCQSEKLEIKTATEEMLNFLLINLDLLEMFIQSPDGVADDCELGVPIPHLKLKRVNKLFQETLPDLYEIVKEFVNEQSDNISDIKYMVKKRSLLEFLDVIEKGIRQLVEPDKDKAPHEDTILHHHHYNKDLQHLSDSRSPLHFVPEHETNQDSIDQVRKQLFPETSTRHFKKDGTPDLQFKVNKPALLRKGETPTKIGTHLKKDGTPDRRFKENKATNVTSKKPDVLRKGETSATISTHLKKDGTPDRRYKENKEDGTPTTTGTHLKKDGTPDRRYKENRALAITSDKRALLRKGETPTTISTHLKKDGTPDQRYKENKTTVNSPRSSSIVSPGSGITQGPLKKDGTPDMRYGVNKTVSSGGSNSSKKSSPSYSGGSGPLKNDGTPDMRYSVNKASSGSRSADYGYRGGSSYSSGGSRSSYSGGGSSSSYCPGPLTRSGAPDMRFSVNKAYYGK